MVVHCGLLGCCIFPLVYRCLWLLSVPCLRVELLGFYRSKPVGRLGNSWHKVRQSRINANERQAVGLDFFGAAFRILSPNGYSPKNPVQFLG